MKIIRHIFYILIALIIITPLSAWEQYISSIYYVTLILLTVFILSRNLVLKDIRLDMKSFLFLIVCLLSLVFNNIGIGNNAWTRLGGFSMLMFVFGPFSTSDFSIKFRLKTMFAMKIVIVALTVLSLIPYTLGLSFAFNRGVSGLFSHSMVLSPIAAISSLICFDALLKQQKRKRLLMIFLFCCSLFMCFVAASRGAVGALLIGLLSYLIFRYRGEINRIIRIVVTLFVLSIVVVVFNPWSVLDPFYKKMDRDKELMLSGREEIWIDRINEFTSSPVIGVGFYSVKYKSNSNVVQDVSGNIIKMETGNSWLSVLTQTGLLGTILYTLLLFTPIVYAWKYRNLKIVLNVAIAIFFLVVTTMEGYSISFGSSLCAIMWLNVGVLTTLSKK